MSEDAIHQEDNIMSEDAITAINSIIQFAKDLRERMSRDEDAITAITAINTIIQFAEDLKERMSRDENDNTHTTYNLPYSRTVCNRSITETTERTTYGYNGSWDTTGK